MTRTYKSQIAFLDELKAVAEMDDRLTRADRRVKGSDTAKYARLAQFLPELRV